MVVYRVVGSGTAFSEKVKYIIIEEGKNNKENVINLLAEQNIITHTSTFSLLSTQLNIWANLKPGKYEIKKGESLLSIARKLKNNHQAQINLVINKLRLKEDLAKLIGKNFLTDSAAAIQFLSSNDSLKEYHVDTNTVFSIIIPNTYTFYWNTPLRKIFNKLYQTSVSFWQKNDRTEKAKALHFTTTKAYILASIVEEETNKDDDKEKIASVYINRLNKNMPLQACPSIKYAMKDFSLTRIYEKYLTIKSPFNTYKNKGLPPGPICTPSANTIDIVLNAPKTSYLFFVAKADFSGYHHFSSNYTEHNAYAKEYQKALDIWMKRKQANNQIPQE